jgi:hypothetical protein
MFVNATTNIVNAMKTGSSQFSNTSQTFVCDNSTIIAKNLKIDFSGKSNFLSDQTLDNSQVADVVNKISQTATQKASSKVEGIAGFILALAVLIAAMGYSIAKPLSSGGGKIIIIIIIIVVFISVGVGMFIRKTPPFFNDDIDCIKNSNIGGCDNDCVNYTEQSKKLDNPPLRYIYGLIPGDNSKSKANLLEIAVSYGTGNSITNGGYNSIRANELNQKMNSLLKELNDNGVIINNKPPSILNKKDFLIPDQYLKTGNTENKDSILGICTPISLKGISINDNTTSPTDCPEYLEKGYLKSNNNKETYNTLASLNIDEWIEYLKNDDENLSRTKLCRYLLYSLTSNPLNIYISDTELVRFNDKNGLTIVGYAKDHKSECYKFNPLSLNNYRDGINGGGKLVGLYGVCNDNSYKIHKFMRKLGIWLIVCVIFSFFGFLFYQWETNRKF